MTKPSATMISVIQGEFRVSHDPAAVMTTVLGSCVAMCLYDPEARIGGMNHFLLPERSGTHAADVRFGAHAMELLINALLKDGAERHRLRAKLFGGSAMSPKLTDIGQANANFATGFLKNERITCSASSLGGTKARRVRFWPTTGRVQLLEIPNSAALSPPPRPTIEPEKPDITLF